jgi:hypothetical protein
MLMIQQYASLAYCVSPKLMSLQKWPKTLDAELKCMPSVVAILIGNQI